MPAPYQQGSRTTYQDFQRALSPTSLLGKNGLSFEAAMGAVKDAALDRAIASVKARFPNVAPSDALNVIGADRGILRGQSESDSAYAARLVGAWDSWPWAGTPYGMLSAFNATGYANVVIAQNVAGNQFTLQNGAVVKSSGGSWTPTYLGDPFWSRFDVLFPAPLPASWVSGGVPASNSAEATFIRALIASWKPAHATCNRIVIVTAGKILGYPVRAIGASNGTLGGATTTVWSPT